MNFLISIPAYLLRNSLHRWLENPASPATKFLVPFLFGLLALVVFGLMRGIETQLREQLMQSDLRAIHTSEVIFGEAAEGRYYDAMDEASLWSPYCVRADLLFQAPILASSRFFKKMPVLAYIEEPSFLNLPNAPPGEARTAAILITQEMKTSSDYLKIKDFKVPAQHFPMPEELYNLYQAPAVAFVPAEMLELLLIKGHTRLQLLEPNPDISTENLATLVRNYAQAEGRNMRIDSASGILERLEELVSHQRFLRLLLGGSIALILSIVLGSLSLLEFRQELYLFALLRSLGVHRTQLLAHYFVETIFLTFAGGFTALWCGQNVLPGFINNSSSQLQKADQGFHLSLAAATTEDLLVIGTAILCGVILSALPFIIGLRKEPGLMLP